MTKFKINPTPLEDVLLLKPETLGESRDFLFDLEAEEYAQMSFAEDGFSYHTTEKMARGVMRGLYLQRKNSHGRIIAATAGRILAVAIDLRPESKDFGAAHSVELNAENEAILYIPPYYAHGFLTLEPNTEVVVNSVNEPDEESFSGIIWDDEILAINWQFERYEIDEKRLSILGRDKKFPSFRSYNHNSIWINRPKKSKYALKSSLRAPKF